MQSRDGKNVVNARFPQERVIPPLTPIPFPQEDGPQKAAGLLPRLAWKCVFQARQQTSSQSMGQGWDRASSQSWDTPEQPTVLAASEQMDPFCLQAATIIDGTRIHEVSRPSESKRHLQALAIS